MTHRMRISSWGVLAMLLGSIDLLVGQQVLWTRDSQSGRPFGTHAAPIGDVNGDGHHDFVTSVYTWVSSSSSVPSIEVFSGADGSTLRVDLSLTSRDAIYRLVSAGDYDRDGTRDYALSYFGLSICNCVEIRSGRSGQILASGPRIDLDAQHVAAGTDLDGDGLPDFAGASPFTFVGQTRPGSLSLYDHSGNLRVRRYGVEGLEKLGTSLSTFFDYDGDGCGDLLLGVGVPQGGAVDVVSGRTGATLRRYLLPPPHDILGTSVAMAGDLDGDGVPDIVTGGAFGAFSPYFLVALSTTTGSLLHVWTHSTFADNFGVNVTTDVDVDLDGVRDIVTTGGGPLAGMGALYVFSGRDGSTILRFQDPTSHGHSYIQVVGLPPGSGERFPRFLLYDGFYRTLIPRYYMFTGRPQGVGHAGDACAGTLPASPQLGVRDLGAQGFRVTLSGAPSRTPAFLVLGPAPRPTPFSSLSPFGFPGCALVPEPCVVGFLPAGGSGLGSGYAAHDFGRPLSPTAVPGGIDMYAQWVVLGSGATWPGGVSEAARITMR